MAKTTADALLDCLIGWGVDTIFGIPGDGINGIMESLRTHQEQIRFIQVRHEESAAFMACAWAKYTGKLGVCLATSGPGGIHLLNGLYDAKMDGVPVLAITGMPFHDLTDTFTQQDVALDRFFMDVGVYSTRIMGPEHVENVAEIACRTRVAYRKPTHITFPVDFQDMKPDPQDRIQAKRSRAYLDWRARQRPFSRRIRPRRAAEILNPGRKSSFWPGKARSTPPTRWSRPSRAKRADRETPARQSLRPR